MLRDNGWMGLVGEDIGLVGADVGFVGEECQASWRGFQIDWEDVWLVVEDVRLVEEDVFGECWRMLDDVIVEDAGGCWFRKYTGLEMFL